MRMRRETNDEDGMMNCEGNERAVGRSKRELNWQ